MHLQLNGINENDEISNKSDESFRKVLQKHIPHTILSTSLPTTRMQSTFRVEYG